MTLTESTFNPILELYEAEPLKYIHEEFGIQLYPIQEIIFTNAWHNNLTFNVIARGVGKTFMSALMAITKISLLHNIKVFIRAPSYRQQKMVFSEIHKIIRTKRNGSFSHIETYNSEIIRCIRTNSYIEICEGKNNYKDYDVILVDEASSTSLKDLFMHIKNEEYKQVCLFSTGFYVFKDKQNSINKIVSLDECRVSYIPYWFLPEGFINDEIMTEAKSVMSEDEFKMEFEAKLINNA